MKVTLHSASYPKGVEIDPDDLERLALDEGQVVIQTAPLRYRLLAAGSMRALSSQPQPR